MESTPTWLLEPALQKLFAATKQSGGELRVVGGAVRDHLLGLPVSDIDLASSLLPERTMEIAAMHGWKCIPTGLAHGTVTLLLPSRSVEITTLRCDVATDGRHAEVAFVDNFAIDALRRDFTINALSMDMRGAVHDYLNGQADLHARRIVFIGDAATRITEDGLRILRFFRFLASHGQPPADAEALAAITNLSHTISTLSGERIATEMKKLLQLANPIFALQEMQQCGVAPMVVNADFTVSNLETLLQHEAHYHSVPSPWVRLLAMIEPNHRSTVAHWIAERWKISRAERDLLTQLAAPVTAISARAAKEWLRMESLAIAEGRLKLALVDGSVTAVDAPRLFALLHGWTAPIFPLTARDLIAAGFTEGKALGDELRRLESAWVASDYQLDKPALLAHLTPPSA
jgi:poly(A) polymerase